MLNYFNNHYSCSGAYSLNLSSESVGDINKSSNKWLRTMI